MIIPVPIGSPKGESKMADFKYAVKVDGVRTVHRSAYPDDNWYGLEAVVTAQDDKKYFIPLFGVWKEKDKVYGGHYYECDNNGLNWKYMKEVKAHALQLANELYGEGL
jgi:hypothetical protein